MSKQLSISCKNINLNNNLGKYLSLNILKLYMGLDTENSQLILKFMAKDKLKIKKNSNLKLQFVVSLFEIEKNKMRLFIYLFI